MARFLGAASAARAFGSGAARAAAPPARGQMATGVAPGLQNQWGTRRGPGGFDSHLLPPNRGRGGTVEGAVAPVRSPAATPRERSARHMRWDAEAGRRLAKSYRGPEALGSVSPGD